MGWCAGAAGWGFRTRQWCVSVLVYPPMASYATMPSDCLRRTHNDRAGGRGRDRCCVLPSRLRACVPACLRACVPACLRACLLACFTAVFLGGGRCGDRLHTSFFYCQPRHASTQRHQTVYDPTGEPRTAHLISGRPTADTYYGLSGPARRGRYTAAALVCGRATFPRATTSRDARLGSSITQPGRRN
eukprot:COSAG02_NODE_13350_length_1406_cov_0.818669_1_plen_188_part_00